MLWTKLCFIKFKWRNFSKVSLVVISLAMCFVDYAMAQQPGQRTFASPEDASNALITATQNNDEKALLAILGPDGKLIISSGDKIEDADNRANFVRKYQEMHRFVNEPDGTTVLYIGAKNWPTPIPLVIKHNRWYFDTKAGEKEILFRRIGRNEISTIQVCQELVTAQKEYYSTQHNEYAQKIMSEKGQHDGLYWEASQGEAESPIGPMLAMAFAEDNSTPYHGYHYRLLTRQGKNDAKSISGDKADGFAFVAYPAKYRSSGVMTFMVSDDGIVYQKDLGENTVALAKAMKEYNLNSSWKKANL